MAFLLGCICFAFGILLLFFLAQKFANIARMKGHDGGEYFLWVFFLGIIGMLMVAALPDMTLRSEKNRPKKDKDSWLRNEENHNTERPQQNIQASQEAGKSIQATCEMVGDHEKKCPACGQVQRANRLVCYSCGQAFQNEK